MSQQLSNDALKLVTVRPSRPFRIGNGTFTSVVNRIPLSVGKINLCLQEKAFVIEHLSGNREVALDFVNYNQDNGPSALPEGAVEYVRDAKAVNPEIELVDENGNRSIINKSESAQSSQPIIHIDLEEQKLREEAARAKEEEEKAAAEARRKAQEQEKARKAYQKQHDDEERQKALDAIMKREQAKAIKAAEAAEKTASNSRPVSIQEGFTVAAARTAAAPVPATDGIAFAQIDVPAKAAVAVEDEFDKMNVEALRKEAEGIDWSKVPEYNRVDWDKDDLGVVRAKLRAVKKAATTDAPKSDLTKSDNQQDTKKTKFDKRK